VAYYDTANEKKNQIKYKEVFRLQSALCYRLMMMMMSLAKWGDTRLFWNKSITRQWINQCNRRSTAVGFYV